MKKKLFTYTVLLHKYDAKGDYTDSEIIIAPTNVLATSDRDVLFKATREIKEEHTSNPDNIEILIRNF